MMFGRGALVTGAGARREEQKISGRRQYDLEKKTDGENNRNGKRRRGNQGCFFRALRKGGKGPRGGAAELNAFWEGRGDTSPDFAPQAWREGTKARRQTE